MTKKYVDSFKPIVEKEDVTIDELNICKSFLNDNFDIIVKYQKEKEDYEFCLEVKSLLNQIESKINILSI